MFFKFIRPAGFAILDIKLKHLDEYAAARQKAAAYYDQDLSEMEGIQVPVRSPFSNHIFHQYTLRIRDGARDELRKFLGEHKIPSMVYYPVPLHLQRAYRDLGYGKGDLPVSEQLSLEVLSLPMHTELEEEQQAYICEQIKSFYRS